VRVLVIGAGVVGTTSAWYLARAGHQVTVLERHPGPALETSQNAAGLVSMAAAQPWTSPARLPAAIARLLGEGAALRLPLRGPWSQWRWALALAREHRPERHARHRLALASLARYSRDSLVELRRQTGIRYGHLSRGVLSLYADPQAFGDASAGLAELGEHAAQFEAVDADAAARIEPALRPFADRFAGAVFCAGDETGDGHRFTRELARRCEAAGVRFRYGTEVLAVDRQGDRVTGARVAGRSGRGRDGARSATDTVSADAVVLAAGVRSAPLAAALGLELRLLPAKRHCVTVPVLQPQRAPITGLIDDAQQFVVTRVGERLRIAGPSRGGALDGEPDIAECEALLQHARRMFPDACDWSRVEFRAGLCACTPSNRPWVGSTPIRNLFVNAGHGPNGWTLACGSARIVADLVCGRRPLLELPPGPAPD
jgi:D-amino-acid dehydrogenase